MDNKLETTDLSAIKSNRIRPTKDGLKDSKRTGEDCDVFLGITNPSAFEIQNYLGYDIMRLQDNFRVMEVVLSRDGKANGLCPLYFNGRNNLFYELPTTSEREKLEKWYNFVMQERK